MSGEALIWLLAGMGIGIALSMLVLAGVAMSDQRQIRRAAVIAEESAPIAEIAAASVKPAIAKPVVPASAMVAPVAANTVVPRPAQLPAPAPTVAEAPAAATEPGKTKPRDMSVEALFAEAFGAAELPKAAEPGTAK